MPKQTTKHHTTLRLVKPLLALAAVAVTAGVTNATGTIALTDIPTPPWLSEVSNEARGISPDGNYVVGVSGTGPQGGFLYDLTNGVVRQPNGNGAVPSILTGIAYRTATNALQQVEQQLILDGMSAGYQADWMTPDGGVTWGAKRRNTSFTEGQVLPIANSLAVATGSDVFYTLIRNTKSENAWTLQGSGFWDLASAPTPQTVPTMVYINKGVNSPATLSMNAVAATGRAVGWRFGAVTNNYVLDYPPGAQLAWSYAGLDGTIAGEASSISRDGDIIFGQSPVGDGRPGRWGYKAVVGDVPGTMKTIYELPNFHNTVGTSGSAAVPYGCTADGKYAVGTSYRGVEKAVIWDTTNPNPGMWTVLDITDLAAANGILGGFSRLVRAYGVGVNAVGDLVVTGYGLDESSNKRAFVMTISPPISRYAYRPTITLGGSYSDGFTFSFGSSVGMTNYLDCTTNAAPPTHWTTLASTQSTGGIIILSHKSPPSPALFYRVRCEY